MIQELQIQCGLQDFNKSYYYKVSSCSSPLVKQKAPQTSRRSLRALYIQCLIKRKDYLYSSQLLIAMSSIVMVQNAWIKALARRTFVTKGMFKSTAARRIL